MFGLLFTPWLLVVGRGGVWSGPDSVSISPMNLFVVEGASDQGRWGALDGWDSPLATTDHSGCGEPPPWIE